MSDAKPTKSILKTCEKYKKRLALGVRILRDANGKMQWADGKSVGQVTINYMLENGMIQQLDADLFGDPTRGQTLGI